MSIDLKYLTLKQTCRTVGFHRTAIWRMVKIGRFPAPIKIGAIRIAWLEEDLRKWMDERIYERNENKH